MASVISNPITSISFRIGDDIDTCYNKLMDDGYDYIEGDIRWTCGGKFCAIGIKNFSRFNGPPITNIIGTISKVREPNEITQDGCRYKMIIDNEMNGDINRGSCQAYLYLYYTTDYCNKSPIKDLIYATYKHKKSSNQEVVQNSERSEKKFDLDLCAGLSENYGYIYIIRL